MMSEKPKRPLEYFKVALVGWPRNPSNRNISETYPFFSMKISEYTQNYMGFTLQVSIFFCTWSQ